MWWWHKVRRAEISADIRQAFEDTGEYAVQSELSQNYPPAKVILCDKYADGVIKTAGQAWIREQFDRKARREGRLETVEVAILIFVVIGVIADILIVIHDIKSGY
jgi:hypothetical protein